MQIVLFEDNLHVLSNPILWKNKKSTINLSFAETAQKYMR